MILLILLILLILFLAGFGFTLHLLWWIALACLVLLVLGFLFRGAESGGWYGRRRW